MRVFVTAHSSKVTAHSARIQRAFSAHSAKVTAHSPQRPPKRAPWSRGRRDARYLEPWLTRQPPRPTMMPSNSWPYHQPRTHTHTPSGVENIPSHFSGSGGESLWCSCCLWQSGLGWQGRTDKANKQTAKTSMGFPPQRPMPSSQEGRGGERTHQSPPRRGERGKCVVTGPVTCDDVSALGSCHLKMCGWCML